MRQAIYRIGIIGTGRIARRFVPEARTVDGVHVVAVYNPRLSSAQKFVEELNIDCATDDMDTFLEQVDAVYIASPHETHMEYARKMLEAGKHVLCEKPMAFSEREVKELFALAQKQGLVFMEGIKTAYCPGFQALLEIEESGKIGEIVDVEACFTKLAPEGSRELTSVDSAGSFYELGSYVLLPIVKILGTDASDVRFWSKRNDDSVDVYTKVYLDFGEKTATGKVGLGAKSEGELIITGTKGYIKVPAPWWLTKKIEIHFEDPNATEYYEYPFEKDGLRYEIQAFRDRMNGAEMKHGASLEESAWMAKMMETFAEQGKSVL